MAYSIEAIQDDLLAYLETTMVLPVIEQGIPDIGTLKLTDAGQVSPFYAIQFGHLQRGKAYSFAGPRGDDYVLPFYTQSVAPEIRLARRMGNAMTNAVLGMSFDWAGQVRIRAEGWSYPITSSTASTEAYQMPASFGILVQVSDEA